MTKSEVKKAGSFEYSLGQYEQALQAKLQDMQFNNAMQKLWQKDASLWTSKDESKWLGWLDIVDQQLNQLDLFKKIADDVKAGGFKQAILLGMGGSSLCVEVFRLTFGVHQPYPDMHVLDSTVPEQVLETRKKLDLANTLMIVASKSGSTTEPNVMLEYFYDETKKVVGDKVGQHFVAITDPGSSMEKRAQELKFRATYYGLPEIGGRYSALSNFGMVPSAVMGYDVAKMLEHAQRMVKACGPDVPIEENPGAVLGTIMGLLANQGRDKVTVITSESFNSLGAWLEQLMAESTGKQGKGLIPISGEKLCPANEYGKDRLFVYIRVDGDAGRQTDSAVDALEKAGQPVVRIRVQDKIDLTGEMFRWEFATAVAGAVIGINAFDQPNVQESKDFTKSFLKEYDEKGKLPEDTVVFKDGDIVLYADDNNKSELDKLVGSDKSLDSYVKAHLSRIKTGDYFAINAYLDRSHQNEQRLQILRTMVEEKDRVATTVGFGPRFLHSTGQLHKGGPNSGVFVQLTCEDKQDVAIPGEKFTFGVLKNAQSLGDFVALTKRDRRVLRVHLPADVNKGLDRLQKAFEAALH